MRSLDVCSFCYPSLPNLEPFSFCRPALWTSQLSTTSPRVMCSVALSSFRQASDLSPALCLTTAPQASRRLATMFLFPSLPQHCRHLVAQRPQPGLSVNNQMQGFFLPPTKFKDELNHSKSPLITRLRAPSLGSIHPETNEKDEEISVGVEERCGRAGASCHPQPFLAQQMACERNEHGSNLAQAPVGGREATTSS